MTTLEGLKDIMIDGRLSYFTLKYGNKELYCSESNLNPTEAYELLERVLGRMTYDRITVELSGRSKKDKSEGGAVKTYTHIVSTGSSNKAITGHNIDHYNDRDELNRLRDLLEAERLKNLNLEHKLTLKDQEIERIKENEQNNDKTMMYIEKFAPIISGLFNTKPVGIAKPVSRAVSGTPTMTDDQISEKLADLMNRWAEVDKKKLLVTIEAIVTIAETDPKKYKLYQSMLLS
jgi:hypothetical protein